MPTGAMASGSRQGPRRAPATASTRFVPKRRAMGEDVAEPGRDAVEHLLLTAVLRRRNLDRTVLADETAGKQYGGDGETERVHSRRADDADNREEQAADRLLEQ